MPTYCSHELASPPRFTVQDLPSAPDPDIPETATGTDSAADPDPVPRTALALALLQTRLVRPDSGRRDLDHHSDLGHIRLAHHSDPDHHSDLDHSHLARRSDLDHSRLVGRHSDPVRIRSAHLGLVHPGLAHLEGRPGDFAVAASRLPGVLET